MPSTARFASAKPSTGRSRPFSSVSCTRAESTALAPAWRISAEAAKALKLRDTADQLQNDGVAPAGGTPEQFGEQIKKEIGIWRKVATHAGVKAE